MKLPRDMSGSKLIKILEKLGYFQSRQTGSHVRLTRETDEGQNHITIPKHNPIKIGTLNNIIKEISSQLNLTKEDLIKKM